ncbi:uncharacterized protein LOC120335906 [Styela clava]
MTEEMDGENLLYTDQGPSYRADRNNSKLLSGAFYVFALAVTLLLGYIVLDHNSEKSSIEDNIARLKAQLDDLKNQYQAMKPYQQKDEHQVNLMVGKIASHKKMCHRTLSAITQMRQVIINENFNETQYLNLWSEIPRGFIHLEADKLSIDPSQTQGNVDNMKTVTGWEMKYGGECKDVDPKLQENDIVIPMDAYYVVYSQVSLHCGNKMEIKVPQIHRHAVQYVEVLARSRDSPKILMENNYQLCEKSKFSQKSHVSYQKGIYRFTSGDLLRVTVTKPDGTSITNKDGHQSTFGVYML